MIRKQDIARPEKKYVKRISNNDTMRKFYLIILSMALLLSCRQEQPDTYIDLMVHPNGRYLMKKDGSPFFWLGDTAWNLFDKSTKAEARKYLTARARQGYTVIQASLLFDNYGTRVPNQEGNLAFKDINTLEPNDAYFDNMVEIVDIADSLGLYIGLLPMWGDNVTSCYNYETIIFHTEEQMYEYGRYIGNRLKDKKNVIYILGGDRPAAGIGSDGEPFDHISLYDAQARGIAEGICGEEDYTCCLMTYHPSGWRTSSTWFHDKPWLDFDMQQNGHGYADAIWRNIEKDYELQPHKPVIDGESTYDEHYIDFKPELGVTTDYHVRRSFYHEVFSGACGHTYGTAGVWQFYRPNLDVPHELECYSWERSLGRPSGYQLIYGKNLILSRPFFSRIPDNSFLYEQFDKAERITATRDIDRSYAFIYSESGRAIRLNLTAIAKGDKVKAWWYDPRNGDSHLIGLIEKCESYTFTPLTAGAGNDWILVLDDPKAGYPAPGVVE